MENKVVYVVLVMMVAVIAVGSIAIASNVSGLAFRASSSIGQPSYSPICEDTDSGDNPLQPGTITYQGTTETDKCKDSSTVIEYVCITQNTQKASPTGDAPAGILVNCKEKYGNRYPTCVKTAGGAKCAYSSYAVDQRAI